MLNDKSDEGAVLDELHSLLHCLMAKDYDQLDKVPAALKYMQGMITESHPSGYPDPYMLACVADLLREEKFREKREKCENTLMTENLQRLIDRVKKLKAQAELVRPQETSSPRWRDQDWEDSFASCQFWIYWLCLQIVIIGVGHFILPSPDNSITYITIANVTLLFISVLCKSFIGMIITSAQIVMYFANLTMN